MRGPGHLCRAGAGFAAQRLGLGIGMVLLQPEGVHAEQVGPQRVVAWPCRQRTRRAVAQLRGIATVEVEQVRPLQRQQVARMLLRDRVPGRAGAVPVAVGAALCGRQVRALALGGAASQRRGVAQRGLCIAQQCRLGERQQKAGPHHLRQHPAGVGGACRVDVGKRRIEERHHAPQRLFRMRQRCARRGADGVVARVAHRRLSVAVRARAVGPGGCAPRHARAAARRGRRSAGR